ncbi:MmcQ/YjbR family DNA-binding protein [Actinoallomurus rhizosphaericola]|uniref:MmcQ/YjbR family DNA-binding protein n=1 Tax=Actinoallomurus rhizosphaericola TaxID=2952536 RepID=UPI00209234AD|nr:MmcQ/YjbR family DNA-binding protein [Actinoallomurus rhizosphaericola]MCO6000062.1 MmcQ/YjbR family DNA-binding protein [Actinoallomurus rhizosphaericola]
MASVEELREIALALPEAEERETWGRPTFRVRDRIFAMLSDDGASASVKATKDEQAALLAEEPEIFSFPAYVGRHGWVGVDVTRVDPDHLRELLTDAWRLTAPKRLARTYEG